MRMLLFAVAFIVVAGTARAEVVRFSADLKGANESPPNTAAGAGVVVASYDTNTKKFSYNVRHYGLTGTPTAAHFHGPADPGVNGPVALPAASVGSPISGSAILNEAQAADLLAGKWYFNIHTPANRGGELRGQLIREP